MGRGHGEAVATGTEVEISYESKRAVETPVRAASIALHTVWSQTLAAVTATDAMHDLEDFLRLLERRTVVKMLAWEGEELVGVAFLTNELDIIPGISPEFFRARFESESERGSAWYALCGVVHPARPSVLGGLGRMCALEARRRRAEVLLWSSSELQHQVSSRSTIEAVSEIYEVDVDAIELDRVSFQAIRLPESDEGAVIVDIRR